MYALIRSMWLQGRLTEEQLDALVAIGRLTQVQADELRALPR